MEPKKSPVLLGEVCCLTASIVEKDMSSVGGSGGAWLDKFSDEFQMMEYYVTLSLGQRHELAKLDVWKVTNSELELNFDRRWPSTRRTVAWKSISEIPVPMAKVLAKDGFTFSAATGMDFWVGNMNINEGGYDKSNTSFAANGRSFPSQELSFVYSDVVLGNSRAIDESRVSLPVPTGYDTVWVSDKAFDTNQDGEFSLMEYRDAANFGNRPASKYSHRFIVKDKNRVMPRYVVRFTICPVGSKVKPIPTVADRAAAASSMCEPTTLAVIQGNDTRNLSQHMMPVGQAYDQCVLETKKVDPTLKAVKAGIDSLLGDMDEKVRAINLAYAKGYKAIQEAAAVAQQQLQLQTKEKLEQVLSIEVELRRQAEHVGWMEDFLANRIAAAKAVISPSADAATAGVGQVYSGTVGTTDVVDFLKTYKSHLSYRLGVSKAKPSEIQSVLKSLYADVTVEPNIKVYLSKKPNAPSVVRSEAGGSGAAAGAAAGSTQIGGAGAGAGAGAGDMNDPNAATMTNWDPPAAESVPEVPKAPEPQPFARKLSALESYIISSSAKHAYTAPPSLRNEDGVPASVQPWMDMSMERIAASISSVVRDTKLPLPLSITRPLGVGAQYINSTAGDRNASIYRLSAMAGDPKEGILGGHGGKKQSRVSALFGNNFQGQLAPESQNEAPPNVSRSSRQGQGASALFARDDPATAQQQQFANKVENGKKRGTIMSGASFNFGMTPELESAFNAQLVMEEEARAGAVLSSGDGRGVYPRDGDIGQGMMGQPLAATREEEEELAIGRSREVAMSVGDARRQETSNKLASSPFLQQRAGVGQPLSPIVERARQMSKMSINQELRDTKAEHMKKAGYSDPVDQKSTARRLAKNYSLSDQSRRRIDQIGTRIKDIRDEFIFQGSELVHDIEAQHLYFVLPFLAGVPKPRLAYSTRSSQRRSLDALYASVAKLNKPVVLVVQSGSYTFGCYLSAPLVLTGRWCGSPASFLFSLTLDVKIPYHGERVPELDGPDSSHSYAFYADIDRLLVGNGDLVIDSSLREGSSDLEGCYGAGLEVGGVEAAHLLAGSVKFPIDDVEVWALM